MADPSKLTRRVVLADEVTRDDVDDLAYASGWRLTNVIPGGAQHPTQSIFATPAGDTLVFMVQDQRLAAVYLTAAGSEAAACDEQLRTLPHYDAAHARELLSRTDDVMALRRGYCLMALLVAPDAATAEVIDALSEGLVHDDVQVRAAALSACTYVPESALREPVERVAREDPAPMLRASATQVLASLFGDDDGS